jgi:hypothetical protein
MFVRQVDVGLRTSSPTQTRTASKWTARPDPTSADSTPSVPSEPGSRPGAIDLRREFVELVGCVAARSRASSPASAVIASRSEASEVAVAAASLALRSRARRPPSRALTKGERSDASRPGLGPEVARPARVAVARDFGSIGVAFTYLASLYVVSFVLLAAAINGNVIAEDEGRLGQFIRRGWADRTEDPPGPAGPAESAADM